MKLSPRRVKLLNWFISIDGEINAMAMAQTLTRFPQTKKKKNIRKLSKFVWINYTFTSTQNIERII